MHRDRGRRIPPIIELVLEDGAVDSLKGAWRTEMSKRR